MKTAAIMLFLCCLVSAGFQIGLALGFPWGEWAMGGRFPKRWPLPLRFVALAQAILLFTIGLLAISSVPLATGLPSTFQIWGRQSIPWIFGFMVVAAVLNTATPSRKERRLWGPVTWLMALSAGALFFFAKS
jgi:hypothetical protein